MLLSLFVILKHIVCDVKASPMTTCMGNGYSLVAVANDVFGGD